MGEPPHELTVIQNVLMHVGAKIACDIDFGVNSSIVGLENEIDNMTETMMPLKQFILPSYEPQIHLARAVCRRAERSVVGLNKRRLDDVVIYLNRLSDYLFTLARYCSSVDEYWDKEIL